jgi:Ca2+:H+ antiporter
MNLLLVAVPVTLTLWAFGAPPAVQFAAALIAVVPLAGVMGRATEHLADRVGPGLGGLLNATFGNAAELIIALALLFNGKDVIVKASLTGSIIGNVLLVLGASLLAGGLKFPVQRFNKTAAGVGATMMTLAAAGLLIPAIFHALPEVAQAGNRARLEHELSLGVCAILIATYALHLLFSLRTHRDMFNPADEDEQAEAHGPSWSVGRATGVLLVETVFIGLLCEVLAKSIEARGAQWGLSEIFLGVIVVAIVGNAAEHSTAILMALKNKMDLALGIAMGSALQIALFVAPVLVFASYLRDHPMDLLFTSMEVLAVVLAVVVARMVAEDGESNWLEGAMLLMIYAILGMAFFFLPESVAEAAEGGPPAAHGRAEAAGVGR